MAYSYDEMQGDPQPAHMGSQSQLAGDVVPFTIPKVISDYNKARGELLGNPNRNPNNANYGAGSAKVIPLKPGQ